MNKILNNQYLLYYLLWPIIVVPKEVQFVLIALILFLFLCQRRKLYFDKLSLLVVLYLFVYGCSILYNLFVYSYNSERIFATVNTFSIWMMALFFYLHFKNNEIDIEKIKKITFYNYLLLIGLWFVSIGMYYGIGIKDVTILGKVLYYSEWFNQMEVMRFVGLMDYTNLVIMFCMFFYPLFCWYVLENKGKFLRWFYILIGVMPIISTYSRSGYIVILIGILFFIVKYLSKQLNKNLFIFLALVVLSVMIAIFMYTDISKMIVMTMYELVHAREGSNDSRTFLMQESIKVALENSPIIGLGIKDRSVLGYPLGSHSTFVGFIYKTGIVGFIIGSLIFLVINLKLIFLKDMVYKTILKVSLLLMSILFVVEDIDGSNWLIVVYFIFVSILFNRNDRFHHSQNSLVSHEYRFNNNEG